MNLFAFTSLCIAQLARRRFACALTLLLSVQASRLTGQEVTFGGIELASTSIKGLTFVFQPGADATSTAGVRPDRMKRLQYAERNTNFISMRDGCKLSPRGVAQLLKSTGEVIAELREGAKTKNLGALQLYGVGSSGLGTVCNREEIIAKVQAQTGLCMEFITASDEARYSLGFVLPRDRYRSLILDIGGGNTKAGYYVITKGAAFPPREWHGFEIEFGARTLKDKAVSLMAEPRLDAQGLALPALTYYEAVDAALRREVLPRLQQQMLENSALENFSQVYMVGGVIWATSVRTRPVQQEEWAISSLSVNDFDKVLASVKDGTFGTYNGNDFSAQVSKKTREDAENELQDVQQRFDPQSLYAGVSLAKFVVEHTTPTARLYFPTTAAWISGYAREKFKEAGRSAPSCTVPATVAAN